MNETIIRTICIKMDVDRQEAVLQETQKHFNQAASWIAAVCWNEHITNSNTAHHRVYGETRSRFGLLSQLAICARAKAVEAVKAVRTQEREKLARWKKANKERKRKGKHELPSPEPASCPQFGARASVRYDARSFSLKSLDRVSLLTMQGRLTCRMILGKRQHDMLVDPTWEIGGADLVYRKGTYYLHVTQTKDAPLLVESPDTLGVDLGIVNLATDSTGETFSGAKVKSVRKRYQKRRQILQKVGTRSAKRRLKKLSGREKLFQRDTNHKISKALVRKAVVSCKALALEDLTGIRDEITVRHEDRYERHSWAFFQLRMFLAYKAAWAGIEVKFIHPRYTSRTCSACGHCDKANRQTQAAFLCKRCGFRLNADYNAALNISRVAVMQPIVTSVRG